MNTPLRPKNSQWLPKLVTVLRDGYTLKDFSHDTVAGLTVAIVALPLAMALAIASGTAPEKGLITAIVAGFLISALGGSRYQIGGPTGAFIPIVYAILLKYGFDGLVLATLMAGFILIIAGLFKIGTLMRYMPQPLITGFTSGIAVIIFASQLKDLLGLQIDKLPAEFWPKMQTLFAHFDSFNSHAFLMAIATVALIFILRKWMPRLPGFLIAVILASLAAALFQLPVDTIGSRFGAIPDHLPMPVLPVFDIDRIVQLFPAALTIAFLAGVESLLSAVVADGMTGGRHRSNIELIGQGVANAVSALFGGLPATGAIARTATNIRSGGRSPVAGILHAVFILLFIMALSKYAAYVPLPALAGLLVVVAWNMSEHKHFINTLSAPKGDRLVLLLTFLLTVFIDLTLAIEVGMVVAAFVFMARMAQTVEVSADKSASSRNDENVDNELEENQRNTLPPGVEVFQIRGPLFFGAVEQLDSILDQFPKPPKVFILRMRLVPLVDASGVHALKSLANRCKNIGSVLVISGLQAQPKNVLQQMAFVSVAGELHFTENFEQAIKMALEFTE
ncbi:MAG: SulP family inorganic anion transporter [Arenimonas sp.]